MKKTITLIITFILATAILIMPINTFAMHDEEITSENFIEESDDANGSARITPGGTSQNGEEWYDLNTDDNGNPILHGIIDYYNPNYNMSKLLTHVKPGDIVFEGNGQFLGDLFGHIAMVVGVVHDTVHDQDFVLMIEAYLEGVCYSVMTPERFFEKDVVILRLNNVTDGQIQGAINWAEGQLGNDWNILEIISGKEYNENKDIWYCSELIWAAYYSQGVYLDADDNLPQGGSIVFPEEMLNCSQATTILHHNYPTTFSEKTDTHHTYSCDGDTYTEAHEFETHNYCYEKCRICDYVVQVREHDYTHCYSFSNASEHYAHCECGDRITESHNYESYLPCSEKCVKCGDKNQIADHDFTYRYSSNDANTHYAYCECGLSIMAQHSFTISGMLEKCTHCNLEKNHVHSYTYTSCKDGTTHRRSCRCGVSTYEQCLGIATSGEFTKCSKCGQFLTGGITPFFRKEDDTSDE